MAHPLDSDFSSQVQHYTAVKKVGVPDFLDREVVFGLALTGKFHGNLLCSGGKRGGILTQSTVPKSRLIKIWGQYRQGLQRKTFARIHLKNHLAGIMPIS
ncbi:hypothetical protein VO69_18810 [Aeromonas salmonicida]|nr:hypothetical protein VO69_18810 [Aeromonas salmonicida]